MDIVRFRIVTVLLLLAASSASAQFGPSIGLSIDGDVGEVSVETPFVANVTVSNDGQATGSPLDQPTDIYLGVSGAPDGWTASVSPTSVSLLPGESMVVKLSVGRSLDGVESEATITVTADTAPIVLGSEGGAATDSIKVAYTEATTRTVLETVGVWIWVILGLVIVGLAASGKLIFDMSRHWVQLDADEMAIEVNREKRGEVKVTVTNVSSKEGTIVLGTDAPQGWTAFLPIVDLRLDAGASETMYLFVSPPKKSVRGDHATITVTATHESGSKRPAKLAVTATRA